MSQTPHHVHHAGYGRRPAVASRAAVAAIAERSPRRNVLLVDHEEAILKPTARYFRNLGWTVDVAGEAVDGEALTGGRAYDLAILDVRVTRFGGTAALGLLRAIRARGLDTKVIVLGSFLSDEVAAEARALGAAAVLPRPQYLPDLAHLAFTLTGVHCG